MYNSSALTIPSKSHGSRIISTGHKKNTTHVIQQKVGDDKTTSLVPCVFSLSFCKQACVICQGTEGPCERSCLWTMNSVTLNTQFRANSHQVCLCKSWIHFPFKSCKQLIPMLRSWVYELLKKYVQGWHPVRWFVSFFRLRNYTVMDLSWIYDTFSQVAPRIIKILWKQWIKAREAH